MHYQYDPHKFVGWWVITHPRTEDRFVETRAEVTGHRELLEDLGYEVIVQPAFAYQLVRKDELGD